MAARPTTLDAWQAPQSNSSSVQCSAAAGARRSPSFARIRLAALFFCCSFCCPFACLHTYSLFLFCLALSLAAHGDGAQPE